VRTRAIIVGIDDYAGQPLTAAVNDACEFHDTILACRLAGESDIVLLTSPRRAEATGEATHQNIINALYAAYTSGDAFERLLFHFSGHGLLAFSNAQQNRTRTALVAREVEELDRDGRYLIDFTELLDVMEAAGPREQFYFVDACRDMSYSRQPGVGVLGWAATGRLSQRTQRCIYAVSPLGQALAIPGERGIFTDELCRALRDPIAALDFDPPADRYVVTTESLFDYVKTIVRERLKNEPFWAKSYNLPARFANESDPPTPLRATRDPGDVPFTVHIVPDSAQDATKVTLKMGPVPLSDEYCYPKRKNHETVYLKPQYVRLRAESTFGQTDPSECTVDLRREHQQTIHVGAPPVEPPAPQIGPSPPQVTPVIDPGRSSVVATATERETQITLTAVNAPYTRWSSSGNLSAEVLPGPYRIEFRLGRDVFCADMVFVDRDTSLHLSATAELSPLMREALNLPTGSPPSVLVSESMGPLQGSLLSTLLPTIGIKPFDLNDSIFDKLDWLSRISPADLANRPLSFVVAVDGNEWSAPIESVLEGASCTITTRYGEFAVVPLERLSEGWVRIGCNQQPGYERIRLGVAQAPAESFVAKLALPNSGGIDEVYVASASILNRASVITWLVRPDGSFETSQNILRLPGVVYPNEPDTLNMLGISYGRTIRLTQVAQKLYQAGELFSAMQGRASDDMQWFLQGLIYQKWLDPLLGCMGYYAARSQVGEAIPPELLSMAAANLGIHFGELPDARIVAAYDAWDGISANPVLESFVYAQEIPILAESVYRVHEYAAARNIEYASIGVIARSIIPDQPWSTSIDPSFLTYTNPFTGVIVAADEPQRDDVHSRSFPAEL
jgi:hypothetical protein